MKFEFDHKKLYIIIFALIVILGILIVTIIAFQNRKKNDGDPSAPAPKSIDEIPKYQSILNIPTLGPKQNYAVDTDSPIIQDSISSIQTLAPALPYVYSFTSSGGISVDIRIPDRTYADNTWVQPVYIFGPDYMVVENDADYDKNRQAFMEAAKQVFQFFDSQTIDTTKLIIQWGDRAFIREPSEKWLQEKQ